MHEDVDLGEAKWGLFILFFVLKLALLLDIHLWLFPLFFVTFIFLSNVSHDDYSFLVGLLHLEFYRLSFIPLTTYLPIQSTAQVKA